MANTTSPAVSTRFLVLSDTHNFEFDDSKHTCPFRRPLPKADVVLHCGDLTQCGGLSAYKKALKMLGEIDAELRLVIAGNHDRSLDGEYWKSHYWEDEDPGEHSKALRLMTGPLAAQAGVTYLEEGTYSFTLKNGAIFTVYASPYTPEFCDWAFPYKRNEDRFTEADQVADGVTSIARRPIPDFPNVDIVMTHGPPKNIMDECAQGNKGCDNLLRALRRARPRMHCFGHIHEGYGAQFVAWPSHENSDGGGQVRAAFNIMYDLLNPPEATRCSVKFGEKTLMVNAAIMTGKNEPDNAQWLVDIDLERAT